MPARDQHSSLCGLFVSYEDEMSYNIDTRCDSFNLKDSNKNQFRKWTHTKNKTKYVYPHWAQCYKTLTATMYQLLY